jgi:hypothetical protein
MDKKISIEFRVLLGIQTLQEIVLLKRTSQSASKVRKRHEEEVN